MKQAKSAPAKRPVGRPPGKSTDPNYRQVTAWLRCDTHDRVVVRLMKERTILQEKRRREFSELVQSLLEDYLKTPLPKD